MALTRKMLKGMGLTEEQVESIIEGHTDTVNGLKDEIDSLKNAQGAQGPTKKPEEKGGESEEADDTRYNALKAEYDAYKAGVEAKEHAEKVKGAYRELLEATNIDPKRINVILRATDFGDMKLTAEGKLENAEALTNQIKADWGDFVQSEGKKGVDVKNPQGGGAQRPTKDEIMKIEDAGERQKAIAENHDLFGF